MPCILHGTTTQKWGVPQVAITDVISSNNNTTVWGAPWTLSFTTDETGITVQQTITPKVLATKDDIDKLATKEDIDNRHTIIYPNGGSKASPASISINSRYETAIPSGFEGYELICETELFVNNVWTPAEFWVYTDRSSGTRSTLFNNKIITQTGVGFLTLPGTYLGQPNNAITGSNITIAPCRVKIYKLSKVVV